MNRASAVSALLSLIFNVLTLVDNIPFTGKLAGI